MRFSSEIQHGIPKSDNEISLNRIAFGKQSDSRMKGMLAQVSTEFHKILFTSAANEHATLAEAIQF
jgi:hypothetical protein